MKTPKEITDEILIIVSRQLPCMLALNPENLGDLTKLIEQFQRDIEYEAGKCGGCGAYPENWYDLLCTKCS